MLELVGFFLTWVSITQNCAVWSGSTVTMTCQSAAIRSNETYSYNRNLRAEVDVSCRAIQQSRYWCALVLWSEEAASRSEYGSIEEASCSGYSPNCSNKSRVSYIVASNAGWGAGKLDDYTSGSTRKLRVDWNAALRRYEFYVDGRFAGSKLGRPRKDFRIELLVASVGENTPNDGSLAQGVFRNLIVNAS